MTSEPAMNGGSELVVPYGTSAARVLGLLRIAGQEGASRSELAVRSGLTPQAVSKITARLRSHGLVTEAGRRASTGGKPSTVLRLAPGARHAVGIHLDRDHLLAVLVDLSGSVVAGRTAPLDLGAGAETVLDAVESAVYGLIGAGLPALGAGAAERPAASAEEVAGGELWQQASAGEVWAAPRPPGRDARTPDGEESGRERLRAVSEEGELWTDTGREARAEGRREQGPAAGAGTGAVAERPPGETAGEAAVADADADAEADQPASGTVSDVVSGTPSRTAPGTLDAAEAEAEAPDDDGAAATGAGGRWGSVLGVGVAAPGPLDHSRGVLRHVTGFPEWAGYPLRDELARRLGMPVVVDKDTNAAALGLALRGKETLAYLHLGTGLGAGLVLDGRLHRGRRTGAGEFGHQVLRLDGPPCRCGRRGCAEALCLEAVRRGDTAEAARILGVAAANLVELLDLDRLLLGGRTVLAEPQAYLDGVAAELRGVRGGGARAPGGRPGAGAGPGPGRAGDVPVELVPEGARTVADGAAQLVLAPLFGRAPALSRPYPGPGEAVG
ncbi:Sugar kinase of the NBD/HSP70 family, may contain an N-terminal HTH domain [Streptomyces sp. WMMB 714]|uniref:ROK family transcriptional regulator n=1 Tax=Streptomyces sp. WMMB 714 TaxID=1286822 RepID=UPI0008239A9C|nr:ROK family transcriptional regulator [Streptomyces sp. WMMB 714]SCK54735.1 Sugar kinase of the NBD/HSP70 family, may contain an N-terminal HTH domain [Streptomyces sp. WMMB 714]